MAFVDSNIKYLKDQLAELNCDWTLNKMKSNQGVVNSVKNFKSISSSKSTKQSSLCNSSASSSSSSSPTYHKQPLIQNSNSNNQYSYQPTFPFSESICLTASSKTPVQLKQFNPLPQITVTPSTNDYIQLQNCNSSAISNSYSFSPSSSSSLSIQTPTSNSDLSTTSSFNGYKHSIHPLDKLLESKLTLDDNTNKYADIMIYLNLKETLSTLDFSNGFRNILLQHYREEPNNYTENINQFNFFREVFFCLLELNF